MKLIAANMAILKNMSDLMVRELWGAYEDSYKQRILQLKKVSYRTSISDMSSLYGASSLCIHYLPLVQLCQALYYPALDLIA